MKHKWHIPDLSLRLLVTLVCLLVFAKLVENNILFPRFNERHAREVQRVFTQKEQGLQHYMDLLEKRCIHTDDPKLNFITFHTRHEKDLNARGFYTFVYHHDTLIYWSTNDVPVASINHQSTLNQRYVNLKNGRYASFVRKHNNYDIVGLILIKNVYTYENKYLQTSFQKDFDLPANVKIYPEKVPNCYPITDTKGQFVWSLIFDSTCHYQYQIYVPALAYFLAIIVFFMLLSSVFQRLRSTTLKNLYLPFLALLLILMRYIMLHWRVPSIFYELSIFDPLYFGTEWFASLGELCIWCIFICFFVVVLYRNLKFPLFYDHRWKYFVYVLISLAVVIVSFFAIGELFKSLIINSKDIFEGPNRTLLLNGFSLIAYVTVMLFLLSFSLLLDKTLLLCRQELTLRQFFILYTFVLIIVLIGWRIAEWHTNLFSVLILTIIVYILGSIRLKRNLRFQYSHYVAIVFVLAVYATIFINRYSFFKYEDQKRVIVTNLASQHDLTAEFFLKDISDKIIADTLLTDMAFDQLPDLSYTDVLDYIKRKFFYSSYWNRYRFQCVVCDDANRLEVGQVLLPSCVDYFKRIIDDKGSKLPRSEFYYINRMSNDLVASYLGWFRKEKEGEPPLYVFIELWITDNSDELGYPELLLDSRTSKENNLKGYSYAKYANNRKISQFGEYKYNLTGDVFQTNKSTYHMVYVDGMEHLVYRPDDNNLIVLSSYSPKPSDLIINFSYIFIFSFLVVSICLLAFYLPMVKRNFQWNFKNKIQYTMIAIMLVSFAIIGGGTVYYINRQYVNKNNDIVSEKMRAIHAELLDVILYQESLDEDWVENTEILSAWLMDLQRTFFIDVNLYDVNGQLIETSLPDIFDKGLVSRQINPDAFIQLAFGQRASILEHEHIGGLNYISAYEPFVDNENKVIAFLNLPYFTQQDALTEEISNVIISITNFYIVIILLTVIVSVVMSNQITQPLMMLQEKFRHIKLGARNEPIDYDSHDEIGGLVKEYNRAIEELAISANRLARSERESAWREMAKQIAHEINNPLTPMKLSIQHLKRAYDNHSERFDEYMEKISHSLVEQIDTLSSIATEFSNFAKMPVAQNEPIDIIDKINSVIPLFATGENKRAFHTDFHGLSKTMISADKEQMSRVFINLFKNALQAVPKDRQPEIHVDVLQLNQMVWIRVKDNGAGIPLEMQEKIFRPNFTTKSSGMGMGLAIVRNIIESADGTISFKTKQGEGTAFIISLPISE